MADWQTFGVIHGKDVNTWAPLGPGSSRGLRWLYGLEKKPNQERAVVLMRQCRSAILQHYEPLGTTLTLHDVQNCLCEFSKYVRGYSKTRYVPYEEKHAQGDLL